MKQRKNIKLVLLRNSYIPNLFNFLLILLIKMCLAIFVNFCFLQHRAYLFYTLTRNLSNAFSLVFIVFRKLLKIYVLFVAFYWISTALERSNAFQGTSVSGGQAINFNLSFVMGCKKESEYAQSANLPFCAKGPP